MDVNELVIEVTRKCQFTCEHCLRGNMQNKNIDLQNITDLLEKNNVEDIGNVTFTGGEPSINPDAIEFFIQECKRLNISVNSFYIATNGAKYTEKFLIATMKLYSLCQDKISCSLQLSRSYAHDSEGQNESEIEKLQCFTFFTKRRQLEYADILSEGKGKRRNDLNGVINKPIDKDNLTFDDGVLEGTLYLNCKGYICQDCDMSYKRQDYNNLGHVTEILLTNVIEHK